MSCGQVLIVGRSTGQKDLAVRQQCRVHFDAWRRHAWAIGPGRCGSTEVNDFRSGSSWCTSAENHDLWIVIVGRGQRQQHRRTVEARTAVVGRRDSHGPGGGRWIVNVRWRSTSRIEDVAVGKKVQAWIERWGPGSCQWRTQTRTLAENLDGVIRGTSFAVTGVNHDAAVAEHGGIGIPPPMGHAWLVGKETGRGGVS